MTRIRENCFFDNNHKLSWCSKQVICQPNLIIFIKYIFGIGTEIRIVRWVNKYEILAPWFVNSQELFKIRVIELGFFEDALGDLQIAQREFFARNLFDYMQYPRMEH